MARKGKSITVKKVQASEDDPFIPVVAVRPEIDEDAWGEDGLTIRQRRFVEALLGPAGGVAYKAIEIAGYYADNVNVAKATASRLLTYVNVREAIARRLARANMSAEWIKETTAVLAASNMGAFLKVGEDGKPEIDWEQAESRGAFVQIRKYKERGMKVGNTVEMIERSIETHNPAPYLALLARITGLIQDAPAPGVTVNVTQISEDDLVSIATRGRDRTPETAARPPLAD